jgi:serine/threonine protein kinase
MQVAQALEAANDQELIHRDIKPGNIMATANRSGSLDVKLIDFGLARAAKADGLNVTQLTGTRDFVGSPAFASPEQAEMSELDTRSDIYSLGVTLWYLLSAKRPFSGTVGQVMIAHAVKPPPFEQLAQMPLPVIDLLRRMLAKSREDRPQNPRELQQEIETVVAKLAAEFSPLPGRIASEAAPPVAPEAALPTDDKLELATLLPAVASPSFDGYFGIQIGNRINDRYRLIEEEREGTGGRLFRATDEKALSDTTAEVALKLLHPGIATDPNLVDLLDNELGVIRNASHPNLVQYIKLERSEAPFLVREWIHGFLLSDLLRWRRSLNSSELLVLLEPLAQTLDFVAGQGLGLVNVSAQKILVGAPAEISRESFPALARGNAGQWLNCSLKLNPLCIAPLLLSSRADWGRQTLVPASRVLSMTQAEAGIRGTKSVWLFGRLIYELLCGHDLPSDTGLNEPNKYAPLPELSEEGNQTLRRACVGTQLTGGFPNCTEFWRALKENIGAAGRPASVPVSPPATPPSALPPPPPPALPPKRRLMIGAIVGGVLIIALAIFGAIRFGGPGSTSVVTPIPAPSVAAVTPLTPVIIPSPNVPVTPVVVATPTPTPSPTVQNALQPSATVDSNDFGKSVPDATTSDQDALILRILKAMETHDYRTFLIYTVDKETDYFGHKNSSSAFIQQDMTQDARSYKWCRFVPDLSTFETSLGHDSIEYDSDALDVRGKEHKARCRLDIYYTGTTSPRLQALSLKVLRN